MIQKAMVLGMARSGIAAAKLLLLRGAEVWVCDQKKKEDFAGALDEIEKSGAHLVLGEAHPEKYLSGLDALIVSPAIDMQHPLVVRAKELGVEVIGEIEYAYRESNGLLLAVTGTNGKTTDRYAAGRDFQKRRTDDIRRRQYRQSLFRRGTRDARGRCDRVRGVVVHAGNDREIPSGDFGGSEYLGRSYESASHDGKLYRAEGAHL